MIKYHTSDNMAENKEVEMLKEKLFDKKENGWKSVKNTDEIFNYANTYMDFMNKSKTEREIIKSSKQIADNKGFKDINDVENLKPGDRVYYINRDKSMYLAIIGKEDISKA